MHSLAKIPCAQVELSWDRDLPGKPAQRASQLRGALATAFRDDPLFHQHDPTTGKALYRYPRVQYRWDAGRGLVIGWAEAASRLLDRPWLDLSLRLGEESVSIGDAALTLRHSEFAVSQRLEHYRLHTPALLFNQDNYRRYQQMSEQEQRLERDRLLVSNLLIAMRGLEVTFPERLYAAFVQVHRQPCYYKEQNLHGLIGEFVANVILPDGFAFGRTVSHGYGWLSR
ncbi:hypothetical protein ThidrDRAFT_1106 [Thiorhodococcus drewsii AZ1]|uniref:Uncharacterized protein n=1 Tax=Thiorhodococcus drewsii AZ1 TaxID=765913 RepID=G2DYJ4_9GAMM|nr:CRISPR-associated endonuclease Cas6 [Thiorhodococcus drewsii]EGV32621.1 hypothetical protein ThidrDRAFT_1106 [Thiorhodococcus drewsii AZ1]